MNTLLAKYRHLIDPKDKMQRSNLKFVEGYLAYQKRNNRDGWEKDCFDFLTDAIDLQEKLLLSIRVFKVKY